MMLIDNKVTVLPESGERDIVTLLRHAAVVIVTAAAGTHNYVGIVRINVRHIMVIDMIFILIFAGLFFLLIVVVIINNILSVAISSLAQRSSTINMRQSTLPALAVRTEARVRIVGTFHDVPLRTLWPIGAEAEGGERFTHGGGGGDVDVRVAAIVAGGAVAAQEVRAGWDAVVAGLVGEVTILAGRALACAQEGFADCHLGRVVGESARGAVGAVS